MCPLCMVDAEHKTIFHRGFLSHLWKCPKCGARGVTTSGRPKRIVWNGIDVAKKPELLAHKVAHRPERMELWRRYDGAKIVALKQAHEPIDTDRLIRDARRRILEAWRQAERSKLPSDWAAVERLEQELRDLSRKKNAQAP